jgi:hypothetical protein
MKLCMYNTTMDEPIFSLKKTTCIRYRMKNKTTCNCMLKNKENIHVLALYNNV